MRGNSVPEWRRRSTPRTSSLACHAHGREGSLGILVGSGRSLDPERAPQLGQRAAGDRAAAQAPRHLLEGRHEQREKGRAARVARRANPRHAGQARHVRALVERHLLQLQLAPDEGGQHVQHLARLVAAGHHAPEGVHELRGRAARLECGQLQLGVGAGHHERVLAPALGQQQRPVGAVQQLARGERLRPLRDADGGGHGQAQVPEGQAGAGHARAQAAGRHACRPPRRCRAAAPRTRRRRIGPRRRRAGTRRPAPWPPA